MAKKEKKIPEGTIKLYEALVHAIPDLEIKNSFGFPYTALNGHMFSLLSKSGLVGIRLPKDKREAFLTKYSTTLYQPEPGPLLKEYVTVPEELLANVEVLKHYLQESYNYIKTLKPKAENKKK